MHRQGDARPADPLRLLAAALALVLGYGAWLGPSGPHDERSALGLGGGDPGAALSPARAVAGLEDLVPAQETPSAPDPGAAASLSGAEGAAAELVLEVLDACHGAPRPGVLRHYPAPGRARPWPRRRGALHGPSAATLTIQVQGPEHKPKVMAAEVPAAGPVQVRLTQCTGLRGVVRFSDARPAPDVVPAFHGASA